MAAALGAAVSQSGWGARREARRRLPVNPDVMVGARCGLLVAVSDDDPVTGRRMLTGSAYADDRHIRARMSIYAHAETAADPR